MKNTIKKVAATCSITVFGLLGISAHADGIDSVDSLNPMLGSQSIGSNQVNSLNSFSYTAAFPSLAGGSIASKATGSIR